MSFIERREHFRYDLMQEINCDLNSDISDESFTSTITNISSSGLCLYVFKPISKGQKIRITGRQEFDKKGIVIWCNKVAKNFNIYKVGLKFI